MAALFQCSSLTSVKDFKRKVASTIDEEDTVLERSVMDSSKLASEMDITQETLTELKDVCRFVSKSCIPRACSECIVDIRIIYG